MIRVLLVDDHASVRMGVGMILASTGEFDIVGEFATGEEALAVFPALRPDLVVCDLYLPGLSGLEVIDRMREGSSPPRIIVLSAQGEGALPRRLLASGVSGYLCKGALPSELIRCARAVIAGERYIDAAVARRMAVESLVPRQASPFDGLSPRELEVLLHLLRGRRVHEISASLALSEKTVSTHKLNALAKLGVASIAAAMRLALQHAVIDPIGGASPLP